MNHVIIVESPAKARTLKNFLGAKYQVKASMGHIRDLPKKELGIDLKEDYEPTYIVSPDKKKIVKELADIIGKHKETMVWLASDEDREGEAIAWHLVHALKLKKDHYKRIAFHEITKPAVLKALENPREIDLNLVHAQQARRVLDRLVGYKLSPLLWSKVRGGLSAGRVQSVAVHLITEREKEINAFKPEEYWNIGSDLKAKEGNFHAELSKKEGKNIEVKNGDDAGKIVDALKKASYKVASLTQKATERNPSAPFITSTLQQEASRKLGFSVKQTMIVAQQLYEGIEIGKEHTGLITYMRTDSFNLSQEFLKEVPTVIEKLFGKQYVLDKPRLFIKKVVGAQEAHEAIRPTDPARHPDELKDILEPSQHKLYKLIWERTLACQMPAAKLDTTTAEIETSAGYSLVAKGQIIKEPGFMKVYVEGTDDPEEALSHKEKLLPALSEGEALGLIEVKSEQKFTQPPARYTEATLVKKMESEGIGRPSTYAPTITTVITRGYVEKKADKKLYPMELGTIVDSFLTEHFPAIIDLKFTAHMEEKLDHVAAGETKWVPLIDEFYKPFEALLKEKQKSIKKEDVIHEKTDEKCEKCGEPMVVKFGRNGKFLSCSAFPKCKNAKPLKADREKEAELAKEYAAEKCDKCGSQMVVKKGRFGQFLACEKYPECKSTRPLTHAIKVSCPKCGAALSEKRTKRGKVFYGCTTYPKCDYATWGKPVEKPCDHNACGGLVIQVKKDLQKCEKCGNETVLEDAE